jgi:hypothetical protein
MSPPPGWNPIVRREFIQTIIGAYQEGDPGNRTVFVSTHLISEFEGLTKELRAVLLPWAVCWFMPCAALILLSNAQGAADAGVFVVGSLYAIGSAILGPSVFGAEFTWRTVPLLLAQPTSRRAVWSVKMAVLLTALASSALMVTLCARYLREFDCERPSGSLLSPEDVHLLALAICGAVLNGFCLGPWLSMQARSALAGAVFSWALPASLWVASGVLADRSPLARSFLPLDWGFMRVVGRSPPLRLSEIPKVGSHGHSRR